MSKPHTIQGTPEELQPTADSTSPEDAPTDLTIPEDTLAQASSSRDPSIVNH